MTGIDVGVILLVVYLIGTAALALSCMWQSPYSSEQSDVQCFIAALAWPLIALVLALAFGLTFAVRALAALMARMGGGGR